MDREPFKLTRDVEVVQIPDGNKVRLSRGTTVQIMQTLGGQYTVMTERGHMVRIDGKDGDVIGQPKIEDKPQGAPKGEGPVDPDKLKEKIMGELRTVFDPEIPVNVVDLGLVYRTDILPAANGQEGHHIAVDMTLTAPGCGMGGVLKADAEAKIGRLYGVTSCHVEIVVDPPWSQDKMSDAAKLQLGMM